jgi:hypothetical protein
MTRATLPATTTRVDVRVLGRFEVAVNGRTVDPAGFRQVYDARFLPDGPLDA